MFTTCVSATPQLINISTRAITSSGVGNVMAGFIIEGSGKCDLVIRAFGKSIGLSPQLNVHLRLQTHPAGTFIAENARWQDDSFWSSVPSQYHPTDTEDAVLYRNLGSGAYTAIMTPEGDSGIGLIGVDAVRCDAGTELKNISTRAEAKHDLEAVIAGFIVKGSGKLKVLLSGLGSSLGLSDCLDTKITLQKYPSGEFVADNNAWRLTSNSQDIPPYLQPPSDNDSALLIELSEGAYTAMMEPQSSCTGIGLIGLTVVSKTEEQSSASNPKAFLSPSIGSTINFGDIDIGSVGSQPISIAEQGDTDLQVNFVSLSGLHAQDFSIFPSSLTIPNNTPPSSLRVSCSPSGSGLRQASLQLSTNDASLPQIFSYDLQCNGVTNITDCMIGSSSQDEGVALGDGYESVRESFKVNSCLTFLQRSVGGGSILLDGTLNYSRADIVNELTASIDAKLVVPGLASQVEATANFLKSTEQTDVSHTVYFTIKYKFPNQRIDVDDSSPLSSLGQRVFGDQCNFRKTCGDRFVSQVSQGANLYVALTTKFSKREDKKEFNATLDIVPVLKKEDEECKDANGNNDDSKCKDDNLLNGVGDTDVEDRGQFVPVENGLYDISAQYKKAYNATNINGELEIQIHQVGGVPGRDENGKPLEPIRLYEIFGQPDENGILPAVSCPLGNLSACDKAINQVFIYAVTTFAEDAHKYPATLGYFFHQYEEVGIFP